MIKRPGAAPRKGRGALSNIDSRFHEWTRDASVEVSGEANREAVRPPGLTTMVSPVQARSIISKNSSPDVPFEQSVNPYQGCEHGCIYCYARPTHAYLGLSPGLDFESRIFAKINAIPLLRKALGRPGYRPTPIALGANTDPYQPSERRFRLTHGILETMQECRHPVTIVTKSASVERDRELLEKLAADHLVRVYVSVTTLRNEIARRLEPRASAPARRLEALERLSAWGIPTGVMVAPIIPVLTDSEMETILRSASAAGATQAGYVLLRLPIEVAQLFEEWLTEHFPDRAAHVLSMIRQMREGRPNDSRFGSRQTGMGLFADMLAQRFNLACRRLGFNQDKVPLRTDIFRPPENGPRQLSLFDD